MTICFLLQDRPRLYGAEHVTLDLLRALQSMGGLRVHVILIEERRIAGGQRRMQDALKEAGLPFTVLPTAYPFSIRLCRALRRSLHACGADVLHTVGYKATVHGFLASARGTSPRMLTTIHGWLGRSRAKERFYGWLEIQVLKRCARVIALSRYYARYLEARGIPPRVVVRIPSGYAGDGAGQPAAVGASPADRSCTVIGIMGRLSEEKEHDVFLRAAKRLVEANAPVRFLIAGEGPQEAAIRDRLAGLGLGEHVAMLGYVSAADFLPRIDVLALSSRIENLPRTLMEAMAAGKAVVATRVGGVPDLVEDGVTGYLVAPGDADAMASHLLALVEDPLRLRAIGERGRDRIRDEFDMATCVRRHVELYRELVTRPERKG